MGPKKAKELLKAAIARQVAIQEANEAEGLPIDFVETEAQLPPPGFGKRTQYIESLTLGRDGFVLTPGSALMNQSGSAKNKSLDMTHSWESPLKI